MVADRLDSPITTKYELAALLRRLIRDAERREGRSLDRVQLAKQINVSKSSLYAYLDGTTLIAAETLHQLLSKLGVPEREADRVRRDRDTVAERSPAAPMWLPLDLDCFAGRAQHLKELDQLHGTARKARTVLITAVSGTGGIGKTALVVHWAHRRRSWFPDGCLHLDLRGFHPDTPLDPADALATLLRHLGMPGHAIPCAAGSRWRSD